MVSFEQRVCGQRRQKAVMKVTLVTGKPERNLGVKVIAAHDALY
jgi:hypothetical protein